MLLWETFPSKLEMATQLDLYVNVPDDTHFGTKGNINTFQMPDRKPVQNMLFSFSPCGFSALFSDINNMYGDDDEVFFLLFSLNSPSEYWLLHDGWLH